MPIGGYKGRGLALVLGLLAGDAQRRGVRARGRRLQRRRRKRLTNTGHFIIALDVSRFMPLDAFKAEIDRHLRELKNLAGLPGFDAIRAAGRAPPPSPQDRAHERRADRSAGAGAARRLAGELGIAPLANRSSRRRRPSVHRPVTGQPQGHARLTKGTQMRRARVTAAPARCARARPFRPACGRPHHQRGELLAGERIDVDLELVRLGEEAGSLIVASNARRSAPTRSGGTPGGMKNGRPMSSRAIDQLAARRGRHRSSRGRA